MWILKNTKYNEQKYFPVQSIENVAHIVGINVSNVIGRLCILALLAVFTYTVFVVHDANCHTRCNDVLLVKLVIKIQYFTICVYVICVLGSSLLKPNLFKISRKQLYAIDKVLSTFDVNLKEEYAFQSQKMQISLLIIIPLLLNAENIYAYIHMPYINRLCKCFQQWYSNILLLTMDYLFINYLSLVRRRFSKLNEILTKLKNKKIPSSVSVICVRSRNDSSENYNYLGSPLKTIQFLHHELCSLSKKINESFNIHLFIAACLSFISILGRLYQLQKTIRSYSGESDLIISLVLSITFYFIRTIHVSFACQRLVNEFNAMQLILNDTLFQEQTFQNAIVQFSFQMINENLRFTGFGFFEFDFGIIHSIISSITSYMVILIQMENPNKPEPYSTIIPSTTGEMIENITVIST